MLNRKDSDFEPGEYTIKTEVVRKDNLDVISSAEEEVEVSEPDGTIGVEISVNTKDLAGKDLVVFETAFRAGEKEPYAEHADIADEDQTVSIKEWHVVPKTGDASSIGLYVSIGAAAAVAIKERHIPACRDVKYRIPS